MTGLFAGVAEDWSRDNHTSSPRNGAESVVVLVIMGEGNESLGREPNSRDRFHPNPSSPVSPPFHSFPLPLFLPLPLALSSLSSLAPSR